MNDFKQQYQQQWVVDHELETYRKAWLVYYETAHDIEGAIKQPKNDYEQKLVARAGRTALSAQKDYLQMMGIYQLPDGRNEKWRIAKDQALRMVNETRNGR